MRSSSLDAKSPAFFAKSSSSSQVITTPVLNPLDLSYKDSLLLGEVLQQLYLNTSFRYFPMGESTFEFREKDKRVSLKLSLLHPIVLQPCNHSYDGYHVEVFGNVLGRGVFGRVFRSAGRLTRQPDGSLSLYPANHVIKEEILDSDDVLTVKSEDSSTDINKKKVAQCSRFAAEDALAEAEIGKIILGAKKAIITDVYDDKHAFIIQDYLEGRALDEVMDSLNKLNVHQRCNLLQELLFAVKKMHAIGIIHRDIKPSNILVSFLDDNEVLVHIVDLNLSKFIHNKSAKEYVGAPLYMPAEVYLDGAITDVDIDAYSVAMVAAKLFGADLGFDVNVSDVRKVNYAFKNLFSGCEDLSEEHRALLLQCIYGLKVGDGEGRFSEDKVIAILDQIKIERKLAALQSDMDHAAIEYAYEQGKGLRDLTWQTLQNNLPHLQNIYQRESWVGLLSNEEIIRQGFIEGISSEVSAYINNLSLLKRNYQQSLSEISDQPEAILTFISVLRTQVLTKIEAKKDLSQAIDYIFEAYAISLTAVHDLFLRMQVLIDQAVKNVKTDKDAYISVMLIKLLENLTGCLAEAEGCSFTLDDMIKITEKLNRRIKKTSNALDGVEESLLEGVACKQLQSSTVSFSSLFTQVAAFFSPFSSAYPSVQESANDLPKPRFD